MFDMLRRSVKTCDTVSSVL